MSSTHRGSSASNHDRDQNQPVFARAALLRAAADDELDAENASALMLNLSVHPEDAERIRFEQDLRLACQRVMSVGGEPASTVLRERVLSIAEDARESGACESETTLHQSSPRSTRRQPRRRSVVKWLTGAVVALALVGLGFQLSSFFHTPSFKTSPEHARVVLAGFLGSEHRRCSLDERALKRKMTELRLSDAPAKFHKMLGADLSVSDVERAGYTFLGAGRCVVPGSGASVHLMFCDPKAAPSASRSDLTCDPSRLSLFIQKDTGEVPIVAGTTYRLEVAEAGPLVVVWLRDGLIYYLVTESHAAEDAMLDHLGLASATRPL